MANRDTYQDVTDRIVAAIEAGAGSWSMPWHSLAETGTPRNVVNGKAYRGVNVLLLSIAQLAAGWPTAEWGTYNAWQSLGAQVRKGEKGTHITLWKPFTVRVAATDGTTDDEQRLLLREYVVFNQAQVDGFVARERAEKPTLEPSAAATAFFAGLGATVRHGGDRAFYCPSTDHIQMPPIEAFKSPDRYHSVFAHEFTHWTSEKSRCDRPLLGNRFGDEAYAVEELIAELGAAFLCAELGLKTSLRADHASYIASWLRVLKGDKKAIFTASSKAQAAVDWMILATEADDEAAKLAA